MIITGKILKDTLVKKRGFDEDSTSCDKEFDNVDRISPPGQNLLCKWIAEESSKKPLFINDIKNKVDLIEADEKAIVLKAKLDTGIAK